MVVVGPIVIVPTDATDAEPSDVEEPVVEPSGVYIDDQSAGGEHQQSADELLPGPSPAKSRWKMVIKAVIEDNRMRALSESSETKSDEDEPLPSNLERKKSARIPNLIYSNQLPSPRRQSLRVYDDDEPTSENNEKYDRNRFIRLMSNIPVVHPDGSFHIRWDLAQVACLAYVSILVPMRLGFNWAAVGLWSVVETSIDMYFFLDIWVNMFTAIPKKAVSEHQAEHTGVEEDISTLNQLETRKRVIVGKYLRGWFLIDFLAFLPVDLVFRAMTDSLWCSYRLRNACHTEDNVQNAQALRLFKLSRMFRVLKLFRLVKLKRLLRKYQDELLFWMPLIQASKLFFLLVFAAHWIGCMYASVYPFGERDINVLSERYVSMVYWAMQTITTVGYGDMSSGRTECQLVATLAMAMGGLIFGWLIQYVLHILDPDTFERKQEARIERLVAYLRANKLPLDLSTRVIRHVRQQNSRQTEDRNALDNIPQQLRNEVFHHLYWGPLTKASLLKGADREFISSIASKMYPLTIFKGELIYGENDFADEGVCVIESGRVGLSVTISAHISVKNLSPKNLLAGSPVTDQRSTASDYQISKLEGGDLFGEGSAFGLPRRHEKARALATTDLLTVAGPDFRTSLDLLPSLRWHVLRNFVESVFLLAKGHPQHAAEIMLELQLPELMHRHPFNKRLSDVATVVSKSPCALSTSIAQLAKISAIPEAEPGAISQGGRHQRQSGGLPNVEFKPNWRKLITSRMKRVEWEERLKERSKGGKTEAAATRSESYKGFEALRVEVANLRGKMESDASKPATLASLQLELRSLKDDLAQIAACLKPRSPRSPRSHRSPRSPPPPPTHS